MGNQSTVERRRSWNAGLREHFRRLEELWNRAHPPLGVVHVRATVNDKGDPCDFSRLGLPAECLATLRSKRPNLLLIGSPDNVRAVLQLIHGALLHPVRSYRPKQLAFTGGTVGSLIIHDLDRLTHEEQRQLYRWVTSYPEKQVITTARAPLLPMVVRNAFDQDLFFRLNMMCLVVDDSSTEVS
jgi:hypothetical protein